MLPDLFNIPFLPHLRRCWWPLAFLAALWMSGAAGAARAAWTRTPS